MLERVVLTISKRTIAKTAHVPKTYISHACRDAPRCIRTPTRKAKPTNSANDPSTPPTPTPTSRRRPARWARPPGQTSQTSQTSPTRPTRPHPPSTPPSPTIKTETRRALLKSQAPGPRTGHPTPKKAISANFVKIPQTTKPIPSPPRNPPPKNHKRHPPIPLAKNNQTKKHQKICKNRKNSVTLHSQTRKAT